MLEYKIQTDRREFDLAWKRDFDGSPPLGYELRVAFNEYWTRFHALPDSKRYADTEQERHIILSRANSLAEECFGKESSIWLVALKWGELDSDSSDLIQSLDMAHVLTWIDEREEPEDQHSFEFWATEVDWHPTVLDEFFAGAAEEKYRLIMFDPETRTVLSPYDGGFDIVSLQTETLNSLEVKYRHWMSDRSDKL